jgi:hypothetical protein
VGFHVENGSGRKELRQSSNKRKNWVGGVLALEIQNTLTAENPDSNGKKKRRMVVRGGTSPVNRCNWLPRSAATVEVTSSRSSSFSSNAIVKLFVFQKNLQASTTSTRQQHSQMINFCAKFSQILPIASRWVPLESSSCINYCNPIALACSMGFPLNFCNNLPKNNPIACLMGVANFQIHHSGGFPNYPNDCQTFRKTQRTIEKTLENKNHKTG